MRNSESRVSRCWIFQEVDHFNGNLSEYDSNCINLLNFNDMHHEEMDSSCTPQEWQITVRVAEGVEEFSVDDNEVSPKKTIAHRDAQEVINRLLFY